MCILDFLIGNQKQTTGLGDYIICLRSNQMLLAVNLIDVLKGCISSVMSWGLLKVCLNIGQ